MQRMLSCSLMKCIPSSAGAAEALSISNIIKPAGGGTTDHRSYHLDEYKNISKGAALNRFQPIVVNLLLEEALKILEGLRIGMKLTTGKITDEALKAAVELSHRYISDRYLPDKAIDLIDEAV